MSFSPPHAPLAYSPVSHTRHGTHRHPADTYWFAGQLVSGHPPHTVSARPPHAAFTKVPFRQLEHPAHTVLFVPAHTREAYCSERQGVHALHMHSLLTYWFSGQLVSGHPPHTASRVLVHAVSVKVPFLHTLHSLHTPSEVAVHGLEAYCCGPHAVQLTQAHALLTYWVAVHPVSWHGPHTVFRVAVHALIAKVPFPHTSHLPQIVSPYGMHTLFVYSPALHAVHGEHLVSSLELHHPAWNLPIEQLEHHRTTASFVALQGRT